MAEQPSGERETKKAWEQVGQHFSDVGKKIGEHYRNVEGETRTAAASQRQTVNDAVKKVVEQMDQAFTGLGNALRDPQTKDSLNKAAKSLGDALDSTFSGLGEKLRKSGSRKDTPSGTDQGDTSSTPSA
jgi:hypothetical protein